MLTFAVNSVDRKRRQSPLVHERAGRYELFGELGAGGMGSVVLGRLRSAAGFSRTVAIKRPIAAFTAGADVRRRTAREARMAARVHHANVVATLDVVEHDRELLLVMEYVRGETLANLARRAQERGERIPPEIAVACVLDALSGLSAVHEARAESGRLLGLIHRDVSPQNVLCGADGVVRLSDFGLAKSSLIEASSSDGHFVGKLAYASPEQVEQRPLSKASDIYAMGLILWELLLGEPVFGNASPARILARLFHEPVVDPSRCALDVPSGLSAVVARALEFEPARRFESACDMARAIEACVSRASVPSVAAWVRRLAAAELKQHDDLLLAAENVAARASATRAGSGSRAAPRVSMLAATSLFVVFTNQPSAVSQASSPQQRVAPARHTVVEPSVATFNNAGTEPPSEARAAAKPSPRLSRTRGASARARVHLESPCLPPFSIDAEGIRHMKPDCQ